MKLVFLIQVLPLRFGLIINEFEIEFFIYILRKKDIKPRFVVSYTIFTLAVIKQRKWSSCIEIVDLRWGEPIGIK